MLVPVVLFSLLTVVIVKLCFFVKLISPTSHLHLPHFPPSSHTHISPSSSPLHTLISPTSHPHLPHISSTSHPHLPHTIPSSPLHLTLMSDPHLTPHLTSVENPMPLGEIEAPTARIGKSLTRW